MDIARTYAPNEISLILGTRAMSGFADGTFVKFTPSNDLFTMREGSNGNVTRTKSSSKAGTFEVTLEQSHPDNDYLSQILITDQLTGKGTFPIMLRDARGTTAIVSDTGWIRRVPDTEFGKEATTRTWLIDCANAETFIGSN